MAFKGLDHVVVRVKNLDAAIDGYKKILGVEPKRASSSALKAEQAFFYFGNGTFLELIQPTDDSSPIAGSLNKLGEGVHTVAFAIEDAVVATHKVENAQTAVYTAVQLAARGYVAGVTLDELLEGREAFTRFLSNEVVPKAKAFGVRVDDLGVKDVVLPGEMKTLLNRVIEAEKAAAANVISRREETAATRSLVNTARLMADQPILLRLKELEAMKEIAAEIHEVRIVVGADGLKGLLPTQLLGGAAK